MTTAGLQEEHQHQRLDGGGSGGNGGSNNLTSNAPKNHRQQQHPNHLNKRQPNGRQITPSAQATNATTSVQQQQQHHAIATSTNATSVSFQQYCQDKNTNQHNKVQPQDSAKKQFTGWYDDNQQQLQQHYVKYQRVTLATNNNGSSIFDTPTGSSGRGRTNLVNYYNYYRDDDEGEEEEEEAGEDEDDESESTSEEILAVASAEEYAAKIIKLQQACLIPLKTDLADWLNKILKTSNITTENFMDKLDNGVVICRLAKIISSWCEQQLSTSAILKSTMSTSTTNVSTSARQ